VHDLAISKYIAGREKDHEFTGLLAAHHMTTQNTLLERLAATSVSDVVHALVLNRMHRDFPYLAVLHER
jgi:hypothetical protein